MEAAKNRHFSHITWHDRLVIERMLKEKCKKEDIAIAIGCSVRTIYYEISRSVYEHTNSDLTTETRYSPEGSQKRAEYYLSLKGRKPKLAEDEKQRQFIESLIVNCNYSPEACLLEIKNNEMLGFKTEIRSVNTIYRAINKGMLSGITMADLPRHGRFIKNKRKVYVQARPSAGTSIEKRPDEIDSRDEFGHWEMDSVIGKSTNKKALLVLTERKARLEIIEVLKNKSTAEVIKALNRIEKRFKSDFYKAFKTITVDNGSEFYDYNGMEQALNRVGKRTKIYYCHARSPQERGTNEVQNQLIRRFLPKGSDFDKVTRTTVKDIEWWMNTYPRRLFDGENAMERFSKEMETIGCRTVF